MNINRPVVALLSIVMALLACNLPVAPTPVAATATAGVPTIRPTATALTTESGLTANLTGVSDGASVAGVLDPKGIPVIPVGADLGGSLIAGKAWPENMVLWIDGVGDSRPFPLPKGKLPFHVDFRMWLNPGTHTLQVHAYDPNHGPDQSRGYPLSPVITINVTKPPVPPVLPQIVALYQQKFNLKLTSPAIARDDSADPGHSRWMSAAYIDNTLYEITVFDSGKITANKFNINSATGNSTCRPAGHYRILVVFVDYGNTGVTKDQAFSALNNAQYKENNLNTQFSTDHGLATPILQVETTPAFISPPPHKGQLLTVNDLKAAGFDRAQFDLVAQVDLDDNNTFGRQGSTAGELGTSFGGCGKAPTNAVDLWVVHGKNFNLESDLSYTLLSHELFHSMGWAHNWPCFQNIFDDYLGNDGGGATFDMCDYAHAPGLFGWEDLDGDGVPEIVDPTPYGLIR